MTDELAPGLYERLITRTLGKRLLQFDPARVVRRRIDCGDGHAALAHHVEQLLATVLRGLPDEHRAARQAELTNELIALLSSKARHSDDPDQAVEVPPEELRAIKPRVQALALPVIAERLEPREAPAEFLNVTFQAA